MKKYLLLSVVSLLGLIACNNSKQISTDEASELITAYLEEKPLYETGKFNIHKQRLTASKDKTLIESIQRLSDDGLITIDNEKARKKWFSKDSVFIITPTLTKEAVPYIVKQYKNSATVKTIIYRLNEKQITIDKSDEKSAACTVILDKEKTPFYNFGKDPNPNATFITQKFKLKRNEKTGWKIIKK